MSVTELLTELAARGVRLSVNEDHLIVHPGREKLPDELRARLSSHKPELLALFQGPGEKEMTPWQQIVPNEKDRHLPFPLTDLQQAYWVGQNAPIELSNICCHYYVEFDSQGIDLERLDVAWRRLVQRHDMLRAVVLPDGTQRILEEVSPFRIEVTDLRGHNSEIVSEHLDKIRGLLSHQVFAASDWPHFDIRATRCDRFTRLHVSINILFTDVYGILQLFTEWQRFYVDPETMFEPLQLSFRDYVIAENNFRDSELFRKSEEYWLARLSSIPPGPDIPLARNPKDIKEPRFVRRTDYVEKDSWQRLKVRALRAGVSPTSLLCTAFAEVLAAWSSTSRFSLNLPLLFRLPFHPQVNKIVGPSTSTLLLEVDATTDCSFEARVQRLQRRMTEGINHRYIGGVRVLRELSRIHGGTASAMMPVVFTSTLGHRDLFDRGLNDWLGQAVYTITQTPQVWLDHQALEKQGNLHFNWDAVEELFPAGLLDDAFAAYRSLLDHLANDESAWQTQPRRLLPAGQMAQRRRMNHTDAALSEELLHSLFEKQVRRDPHQVAVVSAERVLTYEELHRRANEVSERLTELGVLPNTLVAVAMSKGWEQVVAVLGILKSGAAYLPLDPNLPTQRLHLILENGQVENVLTQSSWDKTLEWPSGLKRISVDALTGAGSAEANHACRQGPGDLAYVIFTSGSTGMPKGVMIDHRAAVNTILDINRRFKVTPEDRVFAISSLSFDLSVYDIFGILAAGGTIVIPEPGALRDPAKWAELIRTHRVTIWDSVPTLMRMLMEHVNGDDELDLSSLRLVLMSGDWIPVSLPGQIRQAINNVEVISLGGATEAAIWSIHYPIEEVDPDWKSIPYGRPLTNQRFHVLNIAMEDCPTWVPGYLYIAGSGLAKGYWRQETKTKESFLKRPETGEPLYRTGDLGRYLPDGNIEFLGRDDFQVKVSGHRIELGEIEAALLTHPEVAAAVVTTSGNASGEKRLVGYVVPKPAPAAEPLGSHLAHLPIFEKVDNAQLDQVLLDPVQRLDFTLRQHGIRATNGNHQTVQLAQPNTERASYRRYTRRRTDRQFQSTPIPFAKVSRLLLSLRQLEIDGFRKYQYPSAGSLYPVQTYLHVKEGKIEGVSPGTYYYHPIQHQLVMLRHGATIERGVHATINQRIFDESAFSVFLIAQMNAVAPMYGPLAKDFCLLEAGYLSQLLMSTSTLCGIGLCPVGTLDFESVRDLFLLESSHVLMHSLLGGKVETRSNGRAKVEKRSLKTSRDPSSSLQAFLRDRLPEYMVPSKFVLMDALPLTAEGKVSRQALASLEEAPEFQARVYEPPQSDMEHLLATIVQEVLQLKQVGIQENFFELGADSVQLIQIQNRLAAKLGRPVSIVDFFRHSTIRDLAIALESGHVAPSVELAKTRSEIRRTAMQQRVGQMARALPKE